LGVCVSTWGDAKHASGGETRESGKSSSQLKAVEVIRGFRKGRRGKSGEETILLNSWGIKRNAFPKESFVKRRKKAQAGPP